MSAAGLSIQMTNSRIWSSQLRKQFDMTANPKGGKKAAKVMREYSKGELHSGSKSGPVVKKPAQAKAIAMSEARKAAHKGKK